MLPFSISAIICREEVNAEGDEQLAWAWLQNTGNSGL